MTNTNKAEETRALRLKVAKEAREGNESIKLNGIFDALGIPTLKQLNELAKDEPLTTEEIINEFKKD